MRFVVHNHFAKKAGHHYDLRLEFGNVLKSWAIPKGIPEKPGVKHLAVQTEDHPIGSINFSGVIPNGQYGAGKIEILDKGRYNLIERTADKIVFNIKGEKLNGIYTILKFKEPNLWLLLKNS